MLHGGKAAKDSENTARKTFSDKSIGDNLPIIKINESLISNGLNIIDLIMKTSLANSKSEIRRMINNKGLKINNQLILNDKISITKSYVDQNNNIKVSHGKKQHIIIKII